MSTLDFQIESPLAQALSAVVQPKLVELGWGTGGDDDGSLTEYIILMAVNGKPQDQIAAELSADLLSLSPDDPTARDFVQWLFQQAQELSKTHSGQLGGEVSGDGTAAQEQQASEVQDAEMGDASGDVNIPTGPKSMRNGPTNRGRDKRMLGHLNKAMDRNADSVLHRVRPQNGTERINTHGRGLPSGPRQGGRGAPRLPNGRPNPMMGGMMAGNAAANVMNMNPQQQLELYAMLEQQSRLMAQMLGQPQAGMGRGGFGNGGFQQQQPGRSLFDRVQQNPNKPQYNKFQKHGQNGNYNQQSKTADEPSSSMDVEMSQEKPDPSKTVCTFNLRCTKPDCAFAHQSSAAPPGVTIDLEDTCSYGAACKNFKCVGKHPSPAKKQTFQSEVDCSFWPNCTKPNCPFRHPANAKPLCRNGPNCSTPGCAYTHTSNTTKCVFNPCTKPSCAYKHDEGQQKLYEDNVWVKKDHVSDRKFVDETEPEELIKPELTDDTKPSVGSEIIA